MVRLRRRVDFFQKREQMCLHLCLALPASRFMCVLRVDISILARLSVMGDASDVM